MSGAAAGTLGEIAYRALYDHCPDGVLFTVPGGRVLAANPAACLILGRSEAEVCALGRQGMSDETDGRWGQLLVEWRRTGRIHGVARMIRGDGVAIEVEMDAKPFTYAATGERRSCTTLRDVSHRVARERELARVQLAASRARIVAASDDARRRIERDLHDGAQQRLVSLALELRAAQAEIPPELSGLNEILGSVVVGLADAQTQLREIARGGPPALLANGGLEPALRTLARRSALPVQLTVAPHPRLPEQVEVGAYYVVSEAITNAAKHGEASVVHADAQVTGRALQISVRDDGVGGADPRGGSGLIGIQDRVEALGGKLQLHSPPGAGTHLLVELPVDRP
jgi:PAS domain S-box-containing protein